MEGINIVAYHMCYFVLGNSETWLTDYDNLLLFFLHFSLMDREIGSMAL